MLKAVLFDLDGTLIDSERVGLDIAIRILKNSGILATDSDKQLFFGIQDVDFFQIIGKRYGMDTKSVKQLIQQHATAYSKQLQSGVPLYSGAMEILRFCRQNGLSVALVTGSLRTEVDVVFSQHQLRRLIQHVFTANDVARGKPEPDGYSAALQLLECAPKDAVVVEDSVAGVAAGKRAGIHTIGIEHSANDLSLADYQCKSLHDAQRVIMKLLT